MGNDLNQNFTTIAATAVPGGGQFIFYPQTAITEGAVIHPTVVFSLSPYIGVPSTVTATNVNSTGFAFVTGTPYPFNGTVDIRVTPGWAGSINFSINVQANWNGVLILANMGPTRDMILAQENAAWNHLVGQMQAACK
jgi:hypothetical protein